MTRASQRPSVARRRLLLESLEPRQLFSIDTFAGIGLLAQYYNNSDLTNLAITRVDAKVNFAWANGSPAPALDTDTFSVRWTGQVEARFTENYSFIVNADDGVRLWVNGQLIVDRWTSTPVANATGAINLIAGRRYDILLEYFENVGTASVSLEWSSPSQPREIIPARQLFPSERGTITNEIWTGVTGSSIADLTNLPTFPSAPSTVSSLAGFEATTNRGNDFGERLRGYVSPPQTGEYTFYIAGDESAELWLSSSEAPESKQRIAFTTASTAVREWTKSIQQQSSVITLVAGQSYYIEALHKEASGNDHLAVGWMRPGSTSIEVISGEFLSPVAPEVTLFAERSTTAEGSSDTARFSVVRSGTALNNPLTVNYVLRGNATNGTDYANLSGSVIIPAGSVSTNLDVNALTDGLSEGAENVVIEIAEGAGYRIGLLSERIATATIQDNINAPGGGASLWAGTALSNFDKFGGTFSTVTDPGFGSVIQAAITTQQSQVYNAQIRQAINGAVNAGDILYVEFYARSVTANGKITAIFERNGTPYTKSLDRGLYLTNSWTRVQLPFVAQESYTAGQATFGFYLGAQIQTVQFASFQVTNYGPSSILTPDSLSLYNIGGNYGNMQSVQVTGQTFSSAYEIQTVTTPANNESWRLQAVAKNNGGAQSGDVLRVEYWARSIAGAAPKIGVAAQESFGSFNTLYFNQIQPTSTWQQYTFNLTVTQNYAANNLQVTFNTGFAPQTVQVGGFKWTNLTRGINPASLPERYPAATYVGREGTDAWRKSADTRIEQNRTANLTVNVTDSDGKPIDGAAVAVRQLEHGFKFGTAISGYNNLLSSTGNSEAIKYQSEIRRLFNTGVIENNLKWGDFLNNRQLGIDAANWVVQNGLYLRGHNVIWPSRALMPSSVWSTYDSTLASQGAAAAATYLRNTINARIADAANTFKGIAGEWDIVNEPYANYDAMTVLGNDELLEWFRLFRANDPNAKRALNDYDIFARNGANTDHRNNFDYWLGRLTSAGLLEIIGEQSHYSESNLTDIAVLGTLISTYGTTYNRPIAITEFDFNTRNEQLQADYTRDYLTMTFSQPAISEFLHWGFWSKSHWIADAALYRDDFSAKPNGQAYEDLVFGNWWTDVRGTTRNGQYSSKAFQGDYQVIVTMNGQQVVGNATLGATGTSVNIVIPGNRVPTNIALDNLRIDENNSANAAVGLLATSDPDSGNTHRYALVGGVGSNDNSAFSIVGNELRVNAPLNFETRSAYSIRVRSTDQGGLATEKVFSIQVGNQLETIGMSTDLVVPLYQYPSFSDGTRTQLAGWWNDIVQTANSGQPITVIVNPSSGPIDPQTTTLQADYGVYVDAMRLLRSNPYIRIIGYIPTGYGTRTLSQMNQFVSWYATGYKDALGGSLLDGIFLDEVLADNANLAFYRSIRDAIRTNDALANSYIMGNPGTSVSSATYYTEPVADSLVIYENVESPTTNGSIPLSNVSIPTGAAPGVEFAAIVHGVTNLAGLQRVTKTAKLKGFGQLFITDDVMPNPFDVEPGYWNSWPNEYHRPVVQSSSFHIAENAATSTPVGLVLAFDPDPTQTVTYAITSGNIGSAFAIGPTGQITVSSALDFESRTSYELVVQVTDSGAVPLTDSETITITVDNVNEAPVVQSTSSSVSGNVLTPLSNTGTWSDPELDVVTLSASLGAVTKNANGTWSWTFTPSSKSIDTPVTITATDANNLSTTVVFTYTALVAIPNKQVFYNGSGYESTSGVNGALDSSKTILRSTNTTQTTAFANVSGYARGINGIVLDIAGLVNNSLTAGDFTFRAAPAGTSGSVTPSTWPSAPAPTLVDVVPGNATTPARVRIEWADNLIQNTWLQIIVKANANTGLNTREVYYIGHALGEVDGGTPYRITTGDVGVVRAAVGNAIVAVGDVRDVDKDRRITTTDVGFIRARVSNTVLLNSITIPAAGSGAEGEDTIESGFVVPGSANSNSIPTPVWSLDNPFGAIQSRMTTSSFNTAKPQSPSKSTSLEDQFQSSGTQRSATSPLNFTSDTFGRLLTDDSVTSQTVLSSLDQYFSQLGRHRNTHGPLALHLDNSDD